MRKYPKYKSSGVEWIGDIPDHWKLGKLGYYSKVYRGSGYQYLNQVDDDFEGRKEMVVRIGDFNNFQPIWCEYNEQFENYRIKKGNILVGGTGHYFGESIYVKEEMEGMIHSYNIIRLEIHKQLPKFIQYYISSNIIREQMDLSVLGSGQPFIDIQGLKELQLLNPPIPEQQQILHFLDEKTEIIDKLISTKEQKIGLLNQQRNSLINQVITKGLDPNVKMRNSGVEWINYIPANWDCKSLKYTVKCNEKSLDENTDPIYELNYIEIGDVDSSGNINNSTPYLFKNAPSRCRRILSKGDIFVSTVRTYLKSIGYIQEEVRDLICSTGFCVLTPNENIFSKYLFYQILTEYFIGKVISKSEGVSYPSITATELVKIKILVPPFSEQQQIVDHLDKHTKEIDDLISLEQKKIDLLKEYRQSLISEVITGKINVSN